MRRSLAFLPLVVLVGCTVRVQEGRSPSTANAAPQPAPAAPAPAPAGPQTVTPATPGVVTTPPSPQQPVTGPGGPKVSIPVIAGAATAVKAKPGLDIKPAPVIAKPNTFGGTTPNASTIMGQVFAIPAGTKALPDFTGLQPFATIYTPTWNIAPRKFDQGFPGVSGDRVEWFAIRWEGTVTVTAAGAHSFKILSDDGAVLYLDGQRVVDNDGLHAPKQALGSANLTAGAHTMVLEYFQGPKHEIALQVWVTPPNGVERILTTKF